MKMETGGKLRMTSVKCAGNIFFDLQEKILNHFNFLAVSGEKLIVNQLSVRPQTVQTPL